MADGFTFELQGMEELQKQFKELAICLKSDTVEPVLLAEAKTLAKDIKSRAPRGPTGNLKKSVKAKLLKRYGNQPAPAIAAVDRKRAPHAGLVEYGHGGPHPAPPHPFFRPAVDAGGEKALQNVVDKLGKLIEGAAR